MHGHVPHARLDQAAGQQHRLAEQVAAILVAQVGRFLADIEGLAGFLRSGQVQGAGLEFLEGHHRGRVFNRPQLRVELPGQCLPAGDAVER